MKADASTWLKRIHALDLPDNIRLMNVCGGHERSISMAGLRSALPGNIELIPGPGCPVCVCPEEDIYQAIQIALNEDVILVAFGDMLRVPVNVAKGEVRSLEQARAAGADVRPVASPLDIINLANRETGKTIVFFAAGFETTTAPVAAMIAQGLPENVQLLLSGRLTWPAVAMLLDSGEPGFQALVAPGHVATVMGPEEWSFVTDRHHIPAAVAGFSPESLLAATYSVLRQFIDQRIFLDNCYPELVKPGGNAAAKKQMKSVLEIVDANWRGIGIIPGSGFELEASYDQHNARKTFPSYDEENRRRKGQMPPGCDCANVVLGKKYPNECVLYGTACTPRNPVGPCMVSDEGACRIWWSTGIREQKSA